MIRQVNFNQIDVFLGKNIDLIKEEINLYKSDSISDSNYTYISKYNDENISFFGKKCHAIYVGTNKNNIVTSFFLSTKGVIDKNLFTLLIERYGKPQENIKKGATINIQSSIEEGYISKSETSETLNCNFNDKPDFIIWIKRNYIINLITIISGILQ